MEARKKARVYWINESEKYALECTLLRRTKNPAAAPEIAFRKEMIGHINSHVKDIDAQILQGL